MLEALEEDADHAVGKPWPQPLPPAPAEPAVTVEKEDRRAMRLTINLECHESSRSRRRFLVRNH
jgi:hypothetical protein